jgi:tetratricopeptide (TPR) repeat protein
MTTRSLPALKAYLEAERAFRTGDQVRSADLLRRAIALDSTFALASYRLSVVVDALSGAWTEITETAERAMRHAKNLSERDRLLLQAHLASVAEDVDGAERQYRAILVRYPDELEAWYRLAEVIFHQNPITGRPVADSRIPFERLLALDPTNRPALQHLARIAALEGRADALDSLYRRTLTVGLTPAEEAEVRALWVFSSGSPSERERFIAQFADPDGSTSGTTPWVTAIFARDLDATERMIRARLGARFAADEQPGNMTIARIRAIRGRMDSAAAELRDAAHSDATTALEQGAFFAILPFRTMPAAELRAWRNRVSAWQPPPAAPSTMNNNDVSGPWRRHIRFYLLAQLDGLLRDTAAVRVDTDSLERLAVPALPDAQVFARELAAAARAHALWRSGNGSAALALLEGTRQARPYHYRASYTRKQDRYVRGELLYEAGRYEDALVWFGSFDYTGVAELVYASPAHLRRGQIHERLRNLEKARENYRRFLELWREADSTLQPLTALARERLAALR